MVNLSHWLANLTGFSPCFSIEIVTNYNPQIVAIVDWANQDCRQLIDDPQDVLEWWSFKQNIVQIPAKMFAHQTGTHWQNLAERIHVSRWCWSGNLASSTGGGEIPDDMGMGQY